MKIKNVVILGSTGSIGQSALDVVRHHKNEFQVVGLAANKSVDLLKKQIKEFSPKVVAVDHTPSAGRLQNWISKQNHKTQVWNHQAGVDQLAALPEADLIMCGMVGGRGLAPLISALKAGKKVGLANKEALISAGSWVTRIAKKYGAKIIPVDSEHSAMFQCLEGHGTQQVSRIILTASGGPFYKYKGDLNKITVNEALNHPTWKMGKKITVDSATLMNKGLEAIEAHYLFGVPFDKISIVIHPQSIIHSMVEFEDGAALAQLSHPDMRIPIQYAMTYPSRTKTRVRRLNLEEVGQLTFAKPDFKKFPCLNLALLAGKKGGTAPTVLSAGNEAAVYAFINKRIGFMDIPKVVEYVLKKHSTKKHPELNDIYQASQWARETAENRIQKLEALK